MLPYFIHLLSYLDKIQYRCPQQFFVNNKEFHENQHSESQTLLTGMSEFVSVFYTLLPYLGKFGIKDLHIMLLSICEFHKESAVPFL